jgi:thiol:disulfide interchange protein
VGRAADTEAVALTVSPAIKVFALIGVLVALVMGGAFFVMGNSQETVAATGPLPVLPSKAKKTAAAASARAAKTGPAAAKPTVRPKATAKPRTVPKPVTKSKRVGKVAKNGLPISIAQALTAHEVVVVSLYGGGWKIDPMARDEASAGARAAGVGFVALDVTAAGSAAEALMLKYDTVFRVPTVLVFRRGGELAIQLDGFRDRDTVAQAATNAGT